MTFHMVAFSEAMVTGNTFASVTPVPDPTVTINGDNLLVMDRYNQLFAAAGFGTTGSVVTNIQVQTPSLREMFFPNITPSVVGVTFNGLPATTEFFDNPIPLETNEGLQVWSDASSAATAGQQGSLIMLSDGARKPITSTRIFTMRTTAAITQVASTWVNGSLTFNQTLPVGWYEIVGMRAEASGLLGARLVFVGESAVTRPGCPGSATAQSMDNYNYRMGRLGTWGKFHSLTPPSIDVIGTSGTSQVIYLDLIAR